MSSFSRRQIVSTVGVAATGLVAGTAVGRDVAERTTRAWNYEVDIVCVGSGAAGGSAAVFAASEGAKVLLIEKMPIFGGTTRKSGACAWVPNNRFLRAQGINDQKSDCLRYMARYALPQMYDQESPTFGLSVRDYARLEALYDHTSSAVERLEAVGAVKWRQFQMYQLRRPAPDYADHLLENKTPIGRSIEPDSEEGHAGGVVFVTQIEKWLRMQNVPILLETGATALITEGSRVVGIEAMNLGRSLKIRAKRGVIFGTGGYAQNPDFINLHHVNLYGACATMGSTGDIIPMTTAIGAQLGSMHTAFRAQVVLEEALESPSVATGLFFAPGDSMIMVNKYGKRVVNEKRSYNDRTKAHFFYDATREEYTNQILIMIFDQRALAGSSGTFPYPAGSIEENPYIITGQDWPSLFRRTRERLDKMKGKTGQTALASNFENVFEQTLKTFNQYAESGKDPDFNRGHQLCDRDWHEFGLNRFSTVPSNPYPNTTMHPFSKNGPYFALILGAGALDTNSGPMTNDKAQLLAFDNTPIEGLYGAGNCIATPTRDAYFAAGSTIGPAIAYAHIAAKHALGREFS